jgi:uncharacterized membrane protein (DUF106 family)
MSEDAAGGTAVQTKPATPKAHPMETFIVFASFIFSTFILINADLRALTGRAVGAVLEPVIGFGHAAPVLTILLAAAVMVVLTSAVRHFFTDYLKQAKNQETMRAFNKALRQARKDNNLYKIKRLTEMNKELMALQAEQSTAQMKPMAITMLVAIPIFAWLLIFIDQGQAPAACATTVRVPWDPAWCSSINVQAPIPLLNLFPRWIALYSLFSIPIQRVVQRALMARDLRAELAGTA